MVRGVMNSAAGWDIQLEEPIACCWIALQHEGSESHCPIVKLSRLTRIHALVVISLGTEADKGADLRFAEGQH